MDVNNDGFFEKPNEPCCYGGIAHDCHAGEGCRIVERFKNTPKRTWVGLTDEEVADIERNSIIRAIEAKLKEKNT